MFTANVIGRIGADAEVRKMDGREFTTFRVCHQVRTTNAQGQAVDSVQWVDCTLDGAPAVVEFLKRGNVVYVTGPATLRLYSSKKDRCMKAGITIRVRTVELLGGSSDLVPHRLYDENGAEHIVNKAYYSDVKHTTLISMRGDTYNVDENGWITPLSNQEPVSDGAEQTDAPTY